MIKILRDEPSNHDGFGKENEEDGPHARIAAAIERRILADEGGGTIGLEGDYGSGKSTIVKLLSGRLAKQKGVSLVVFDAWAHEGDPLRRAFLETLIDKLMREPVGLIPEKWIEQKERLAQRHRRSTETKKSSPSGFGIWIALATALVPVGLFVTRVETSKVIEAGKPSFQIDQPQLFGWSTWFGLLLLTAPISVAAIRFLTLVLGVLFRKVIRLIPKSWSRSLRSCTYKFRKRAPSRFRSCFNTQHFNFLAQQGTLESESDAYESSDPTSIEFERLFSDLIRDAIEGTKNRIVLVVDNLDRLTAKQSLSVWSNLQTFVSRGTLDGNGWSEQFTLLVPYTPNAIEKLWDEAGAVTSAESFFEKTFQVRYATPPPTMSNWQGHLRKLLGDAEIKISATEKEHVLEVFELMRRQRAERIVPRQLKLHVNSLAVLWDMWEATGIKIPASHLAYAVLHRADRNLFEELLRRRIERLPNAKEKDSDCLPFPSVEAIQVCGPKLVESLAAIHFNVPPEDAIQLLLEDQIQSALQRGDPDTLASHRDRNTEAFWLVLRRIVRASVGAQNPETLAAWARGLQFFHESELPAEAARILKYIRQQISSLTGAWHPLDDDTTTGLIAWLGLDRSEEMRIAIVAVGERTAESTNEDIELDSKLAMVDAFRAETLRLGNELTPNVWEVAMTASDWLDTPAERTTTEQGVCFVQPMCSSQAIVDELCERATTFRDDDYLVLDESDIAALGTLWSVRESFDGSKLCSAITDTLQAKAQEQTEEATFAVSECVNFLHALRLIGEESADTYLKEDETALIFLNAWTSAKAINASSDSLTASLLFSHPSMEIDKDFPSVAETTRKAVKSMRKNGGLEESKLIWKKLRDYQCEGIVGALAGSNAGNLMGDMIEAATADGDVNLAVPTWFPRVNAGWMKKQFADRETKLSEIVEQLQRNENILLQLCDKGEPTVEKDRDCVEMFLEHGDDDARKSISNAYAKKLRTVSRSNWEKDLTNECSLISFAYQIQNLDNKPVVGSPFKTAMKNSATAVARGELDLSEDVGEMVSELINRMAPSMRKELGKQVLNEINRTDGGLNQLTITLFGQAISEATFDFSPEELARLTARSLHSSCNELATWIVNFLNDQDRVLAGVKKDAQDLLRVELDSAEQAANDDDLLDQLEKLRDMFSIPRPTVEVTEDKEDDQAEASDKQS